MEKPSSNKSKALIPAPPSFSSAPDYRANIPVPTFSSAPAFVQKKDERTSRHESSPSSSSHRSSYKSSSRSSKRYRSRSPKSKRSRSPTYRSRRSRSPTSRYRSRSPTSRSSQYEKSHRLKKRLPSPEVVHTGTLNSGITFTIDKRGDSNNSKYEGTHSYSAPIFKRAGGGRAIGLPAHKRIDTSSKTSGKTIIYDISDRKRSRYTDPNYSWKEFDKSLKKIRIKPKKDDEKDPFASRDDFIKIDAPQTKTLKPDNETLTTTGVDYRSLEGNKVKMIIDEDQASDQEEGESFEDQVRQRTIHYNRRLDSDPENVQLWLEFIQFQDESAAGLDPLAIKNKSNKASLNEVKLSIFEKALDYNPTDESLIIAYLTCGSEVWDTLKLLREWDGMLKKIPDSIMLWSNYINMRQTNFASFTFTQCVQVFEDALLTLSRHAKRKMDDYEGRESIESLMVYILLRACLFMKQSGYHERAFAVIQAAVEFNLFQPRLFSMTNNVRFEEKVKSFMEFWDSEVLRFGEEGALGWSEYYRASDNGEDVPEPEFDGNKNEEEEDEFTNLSDWFRAETAKEENDRMPLRLIQAEDESMDEDPYRTPLSDDVKTFLFSITTAEARQSLIYSVLVFLGLPYTPPDVGTNTHFCTDTFTHNDLALANFWPANNTGRKYLVWYVSGVAMNPEETVSEMNPYNIPNSYPVGLNEMFAKSGKWFKCSGREFIACRTDEKFARNTFQQLLKIEDSEYLTVCYLAFESSCGQKMGRKLAKSMLKDQRNNLVLWNAYAQMEKSYDRIDEARKVYLTALSMYRSLPESDQLSVPLLYLMFAKLELENGRPNEALKVFVSISDSKPYDEKAPLPTATSVLRTREYFTHKLAQLSTLSEIRQERQAALNTLGCSALFEYLSSGLESAILVYELSLDYIKGRGAERGYESEVLWTEYVSLLYHHTTIHKREGYKPSLVRNAMERALRLFPNNTIFLAFYIWNESKTKVHNRVHNLLNSSLKKESNVILWLSAIYSELHQYQPYHVNSVRDFFERSIQDTRTKSSIILWKNYIQFELNQDNIERARNLYYRSIRECPWSKELYLIGIQSLEKTMNEKELNELVSLIMEKEIRIRIPIDEDLLVQ